MVLITDTYTTYIKPTGAVLIWSKRSQWECKQISRREMVIPQTGRLILTIKQHLHTYTKYLCFSPCSSLHQADSTVYCPNCHWRVSVSLSNNKHSEGKYVTKPHLYIHDNQRNVLLCGRSCDDMICTSFKSLGKQPSKLSLRLLSLLETDAST